SDSVIIPLSSPAAPPALHSFPTRRSSDLNGLMTGSTYAVVALGFSLVFSVMRVVNMAHPEFFMAGAFGAFLTITYVTRNVLGVFVGGMAVALVVGLMVERLAIRPVRGRYI